jgi:hypothetical protein
MYRGHTKKEDSEREKGITNSIKKNFGDDFSAKLKSTRRNGVRDWRKEQGQGSASLRRYIAKKMQ